MTKERILNRQRTRRIFTQKVFTSSLLRVWTVCPPLQVGHRYSPLLAKHTNCTQTTSPAPANVLWYNSERTGSDSVCCQSLMRLFKQRHQVFFTRKQKNENRNMYLKTSENGCLTEGSKKKPAEGKDVTQKTAHSVLLLNQIYRAEGENKVGSHWLAWMSDCEVNKIHFTTTFSGYKHVY